MGKATVVALVVVELAIVADVQVLTTMGANKGAPELTRDGPLGPVFFVKLNGVLFYIHVSFWFTWFRFGSD